MKSDAYHVDFIWATDENQRRAYKLFRDGVDEVTIAQRFGWNIGKLRSVIAKQKKLADQAADTSNSKGVHYREGHAKPWTSTIAYNGKTHHLGSFTSETAAHQAWLIARRRIAAGQVPRDPHEPKGAYRNHNGFRASIRAGGKSVALGTFKTEAEAKAAYQEAKQQKRAGLPITPRLRLLGRFSSEAEARECLEHPRVPRPRKPRSNVTYDHERREWKVQAKVDGKPRWWIFTDQEKAVAKAKQAAATPGPRKQKNPAKGYTHAERVGTFAASIMWNGKPVYLGAYDDEQAARHAYATALERINAGLSPVADVEPGITVDGEYRVQVRVGDELRVVGSFRTREAAREAYFAARLP